MSGCRCIHSAAGLKFMTIVIKWPSGKVACLLWLISPESYIVRPYFTELKTYCFPLL